MRMLHVRSISFFTPLGRVAGRLAGRTALGVGAGAGTIAFADYKLKSVLPSCPSSRLSADTRHAQT